MILILDIIGLLGSKKKCEITRVSLALTFCVTLQSPLVTTYAIRFNIPKFYVLATKCTCCFYYESQKMYLLFPCTELICFYNCDVMCLLRGTNCISN